MIYFKMCFKVPYFLSDHAAFAKRYCKNKQNINSLTCFPHTFGSPVKVCGLGIDLH